MPSRTSLFVAFGAIYLIWGSTYLGIRVAVEAMPPFLLAGARFIIAGALLFAFLKHSTPARVATYAYVNPIVAIFLGWLLLHEPVTSRTLIASAVIIAAVVIITVQKSKPVAG
ncbi:MAG: EamA family transporter [Verrucomicrobia bacterium]|nr:EamA family transporter [Verrucomicrobiota bacterium]